VRIAIINTVSIWTVGDIIIQSQYAHAGIDISKIIVKIVITANMDGEITVLIAEKEISI
jgi:hypothetical protein